MPNNFTPPNFHEDQPSALETGLATQIGAHNPVGAMAMLIPEAQRRAQAQGDYHDYMSQINAQQTANLQNNRNENTLKAVESANSHPIAGFLPWAMSNGLMPSGPGAGGYNQGYDSAAAANNIDKAGGGLGKFMEAGGVVTPNAMGQFIPSAPGQPAVTGINPPGIVQAAGLRANADLQGKAMGLDTDKNQVDVPTDPNSPLGLTGGKITYKGRAATDYINAHPADTTPQISPAVKNNAMVKLHAANPTGYDDVLKGGGKIAPDPSSPSGMSFVGASGKRYH